MQHSVSASWCSARAPASHATGRLLAVLVLLASAACSQVALQPVAVVPDASDDAPSLGRRPAATTLPSPMAPLLDGGQRTLPRRGEDMAGRWARRGVADQIEAEILPIWHRPHPRIASDAKGSISIGTVTGGFLVAAAEVPVQGPHHQILERIAPRNARFTTDEMRDLLLCAAAAVAKEHPKATLGVGNLSRAAGGDTPWSVSHNNGRDADLAFYSRTTQGKPIVPDHLYDFGRNLTAAARDTTLVFDVEANWSLVKGLIRCEKHAQIEFLFAAAWLERAMLQFARAKGEEPELLARAAALLHQPRKAANHADHLHIRIGCAADDLSEGCLKASRAPQSAIGQAEGVRRRLPAIRAALKNADPAARAGAAELLALYNDSVALDSIVAALSDSAAEVRGAAAASVLRLAPGRAAEVAAAAAREPDAGVASQMLHGLLAAGAVPALATVAAAPDCRHLALTATLLGCANDLSAARPLVALLGHDDALVRASAREGLERLCNRSTHDLLLARGDVGQPAGAVADQAVWRAFVEALPADASRMAVVIAGFAERGVRLEGVGKPEIPQIAAELGSTRPYADNAGWLLTKALRYEPEEGRGARAAPAAFWWPWLRRRSLLDETTFARLQRGEPLVATAVAGSDAHPVATSSLLTP